MQGQGQANPPPQPQPPPQGPPGGGGGKVQQSFLIHYINIKVFKGNFVEGKKQGFLYEGGSW